MIFTLNKNNSCCIIGHRKIYLTEKLINELYKTIETLITKYNVVNFIFGSKSQFNDLCYKIVTKLKENYPDIKRIYVRAEYPNIDKQYEKYLLSRYEYTIFPKEIENAGKAVYIERNYKIIDLSNYCIMYYNENIDTKSGTQLALKYAQKKKVKIINTFK